MIKLDLKDKKLLYELDINSRHSFHEIAKKIGLSKDSVIYRIKRLQEAGIIKYFHTIINVGKLGFMSFRLYLKLQNTTPEKEQEIIEFLKNQKILTWLASIEGNYDLGMWLLTKSIKELNQFWKQLLKSYGNFISKRQLAIFTRVAYYPRAYFLDLPQNLDEYVFITEPEEADIDEKDIEILKLLAPNSRIPILEIAKSLKITPKTAALRIKELEKRKIIVGYRTLFDLEKLEEQYFKLFIKTQNSTEEKERQFRNFVKQHPNIIYDNQVLGGEDFEIEIQVHSLQELRSIINQIKERFSQIIKEYDYMLFYKEHKFLFFPL